MTEYMARLGDFTFNIETAAFQSLERVSGWRWQGIDRVGRKPAQHNTGQEADTITLSGIIYPHYKGGLGQVGRMRAQANIGKPLPLIYAFEATGQYCGLWCIKTITEGRTVFFSNGAPRRIEFSLTLVEYGEDAQAENAGAALSRSISASLAAGPAIAAKSAASSLSLLSRAKSLSVVQDVMDFSSQVTGVVDSVADTVKVAYDSFMASGPGTLLKAGLAEAENVLGAVSSLKSAAALIESAGTPSAMLSAVQNLSSTAGASSGVLGSFANELGAASGLVDGFSSVTMFSREVGMSVSEFQQLSTATSSIADTADLLEGILL